MPRNKNLSGFTLLELLIAVSLVAFIFVALASSFTAGLRVYSKVSSLGNEEGSAFFLERFTMDFRNSVVSEAIPFSRSAHSLSFAMLKREEESYPVEVSYFWDEKEMTIIRMERDVSYAQSPDKREVLLTGVKRLTFDSLDGQKMLSVTLDRQLGNQISSTKKSIWDPSVYAFKDR